MIFELPPDMTMNRHASELLAARAYNPSEFGSQEAYRAARAAAWAALIEGGVTLSDIGRAVGLSRERVRQILRREGFDCREGTAGQRPPDPLPVMRALRNPACDSLTKIEEMSGVHSNGVKRILRELGLHGTAKRLLRARARRAARTTIVTGLKDFAELHGRSPGIQDAIQGRLPFSHTHVVVYFKTWNKGIAAAGLSPRSRGARSQTLDRGWLDA